MSAFVSAVYFDDVLNMWVRGMSAPEITESVGDPLTAARVTDIIKRARRSGDPRAIAKKRGGSRSLESVWTTERRARLIDLIDAGYSSRHIAREMDLTAGQVGGFIVRNGLKLARQPNTGNGKPKREKNPAGGHTFNTGFQRRAFVQPKSINVEGAKPVVWIPSGSRRRPDPTACATAIEQLGDKDCRFPIGDPRSSEFHFCGHDRLTGKPYCSEHFLAAYPQWSDAV